MNITKSRSVSSRPVSPLAVRRVACELFAARGYQGTSMKDIAEVLDVRAPSLYNHMTSKQNLLFEIMDVAMDRALRLLELTLVGVTDVSEQLRLVTEASVLDFLEHPAEITVCNTEIRSLEEPYRSVIVGKRDRYAHRIIGIVQRGCEEGRFLAEEPRVASFAVLELGNNAKAWFKPGGKFSAAKVAHMYAEFALRVVGTRGANLAWADGEPASQVRHP